jgi:SAM-dependent methyltransferase
MTHREFDDYARSYSELLSDPVRDWFSGGSSRFYHERKRDVIRSYFQRQGIATRGLRYLDLGCGEGDLLALLRDDFAMVAGCDPSGEMLKAAKGIEIRLQLDPATIPYDTGEFDFVTAVCVYHHVDPQARLRLTREIQRVITPGGTFAIIEHNPYNPATRLIVSRTPVDANAKLLTSRESRKLVESAGFRPKEMQYFLYFPESLYPSLRSLESWLSVLPFGGQYAFFATNDNPLS